MASHDVKHPSGRRVPEPRCSVTAGGQDEPSVPTEDRGRDGIEVAAQNLEAVPARGVPDPRRAVTSGADDTLSVRAEGDASDGVTVTAQNVKECSPLAARQSTGPSRSPPVTTRRPSGLKAAARTPLWLPLSVWSLLPFVTFQIRAVLSSLEVTTSFPSGLNAAASTGPAVPTEGVEALAVRDVPDPCGLVVAGGGAAAFRPG